MLVKQTKVVRKMGSRDGCARGGFYHTGLWHDCSYHATELHEAGTSTNDASNEILTSACWFRNTFWLGPPATKRAGLRWLNTSRIQMLRHFYS